MVIKVVGIEELFLKQRHINLWSENKIYPFNSKEYFKLLNPEYQSLDNKKNQERLEILKLLSNIKNTNYLVLPKDIYVTANKILGYTMPVAKGKNLEDFTDNISYQKIIMALSNLLVEIKILSDMGIFNPDIWSDNVLFDVNNLYLIDFDASIFFNDQDLSYKMMGMSLFNLVLDKIIASFDLDILKDKDINYIKLGIDSLKTTDYIAFLNLLKIKLNKINNENIKTVGQVRKVLKLVENGHN